MRKLTFILVLVALLVVSTAVVYAAVEWDDDPHIGHGIWLSWKVVADEPAVGWRPDARYKAEVENHHGEIEAKATVWTARYRGHGKCTLSVALSDGKKGTVLATKSGHCGRKVKVKWESD